ncbi:AAA family ATPase [Verrucomicrobium spinosum]|uniref:AAA family ATPase n=1 Tax=Verrucomicrobium spinosum TaxID=2736 RepID=UPI0009D68522|nr:ATP-binding protein [Verrucomicrobium spinosum]
MNAGSHLRVWIVITGAPSSGKTTLLRELKRRGYAVVSESAREVLESGELDESRSDVQTLIEERQQAKEQQIPPGQVIVLDRALPDSLAYRRLGGLDASDLRALIRPERYAAVFMCGFGQHIADGLRKDDVERAREIERLLREVYLEIGCRVIDLPWFTAEDPATGVARRLALIEEELGIALRNKAAR